MSEPESTYRRPAALAAVACATAATAVLLSGCGNADDRTENGGPPPSAEWTEPANYRYTLSLFGGRCGDEAHAEGSWAITVADGAATRAKPLDAAARARSWAEGAPTIGELHDNALAIREGGAYDAVDIDYTDHGPDAGRPTRIHYLAHHDESCKTLTHFTPTD